MTYYQWAHGGKVVTTDCAPGACLHAKRWGWPEGHVHWAWDRSLGAWVHYVAPAWGKEAIATVHHRSRLDGAFVSNKRFARGP